MYPSPVQKMQVRALGGLLVLADPHSEPPDSDQEPHLGYRLKLYWVQVWRNCRWHSVKLGICNKLPGYCRASWTLSGAKSFESF